LHRNGAGCSSGTPKAGMGDQNRLKALWIDDDGLRPREGGGQSWGDGVRLIREYGGRGENAWWMVVGYGGRAARQLRANCAVHGGSESRSDLGSSTTAPVQPGTSCAALPPGQRLSSASRAKLWTQREVCHPVCLRSGSPPPGSSATDSAGRKDGNDSGSERAPLLVATERRLGKVTARARKMSQGTRWMGYQPGRRPSLCESSRVNSCPGTVSSGRPRERRSTASPRIRSSVATNSVDVLSDSSHARW
jgi:hypothetical protein